MTILNKSYLASTYGEQTLNEITKIDLENISEITQDTFINLPNVRTLHLRQSSITCIPESAFEGLDNLEELRLDNTKISEIAPDAFKGLSNLRILSLEHNQLESIVDAAFHGLENLEKLFLCHNHICQVSSKAFDGLSKLQELSLSNNKLKSVQDLFTKVVNLRQLRLDNNQIAELGNGNFQQLINLTNLTLENNELESIFKNSLTGLTNLETIELKKNQISFIQEAAFRQTPKLKILSLHNNKLRSIAEFTFEGLEQLQELYLENNQIATVEVGAFRKLTQLKSLLLFNNQLQDIVVGTFDHLEKLEELRLHSNMLWQMTPRHFESLKSIQQLTLGTNWFDSRILSFSNREFSGLHYVWPKPQCYVSDWANFLRQFSPRAGDFNLLSGMKTESSEKMSKTRKRAPLFDLVICPICDDVLREPVRLPCDYHSICKHHQKNLTKIECHECQQTFDVPQQGGGFPPNRIIETILEKNILSVDLGPEHMLAWKKCNNFQEFIDKLKELESNPSVRVQEAVNELRARIDLRREKLKLKVDEEALELMQKLDELEKECLAKSLGLDMSHLSGQIVAWENDLKCWRDELNSFKREDNKWKRIFLTSDLKISEGLAVCDKLSKQIGFDKVRACSQMAEAFGTSQLICGHTLTFTVANLREKLRDGRKQNLKSDLENILGMFWAIGVDISAKDTVRKLDAFLIVQFQPRFLRQVRVGFDFVMLAGPNGKQLAHKEISNDFSDKTESGFDSALEIKEPIELDGIFGDASVDSITVKATIKKIELVEKKDDDDDEEKEEEEEEEDDDDDENEDEA